MATTKTTDATPETTDVQAPAAVKVTTATTEQTAVVTHAVTSRPLVETAAPNKGESIEGALADRRIPVSRTLS